jgi:DNA-binding CsgD family transcriptional regulator/tetratricopeptide (TPR) repeat protein
MRQVLCPVLVGREDELRVLLGALDGAAAGRGTTALVVGEAGSGKSRLARELSGVASARGLPVLTGRAAAGAVPVAFRPLAEAVLGELRRGGLPDLPELRPFRPALGRLVPEWQPREPLAGAESLVVLAEGILRLLRALAGDRGCLLVLEDLHWADPETLAVLEYLADNLTGERVLCLATLRSEEGAAGRELAAALAARRAAAVVPLARLEEAAVVGMARACLGAAALPAPVETWLGASADGLPFLVEELLAGLVGAALLVEEDGRWSTTGPLASRVPPTFAGAVGRRLEGLSPPTRDLLHAAAVLGRRFDWSLLPAVTGLDEPAVVAGLRQAVGAQLLTAEADGFRFRHALTRDAVLGTLLPPERTAIAGRALAAVELAHPGLPGVWCELAADLAEAAGNRPRAAGLLLEAGRRALAAGALATADATLERARGLAGGDPVLAAPIGDALVETLALAGQVDRAFELGGRLLARLDRAPGPPTGPVGLHLRLARAAVAAGRWPVAADHLAAARCSPAPPHGEEAARLDALEAQVALGEGRLDEAERLATRALAVAEQAGLAEVACEALEVAGRIARQRDLEAAEAAFARGLAVATAHGLELWRLRALHELGTIDQLRTESVQRLLQARDLAAEVGAVALAATLDLQIGAGLVKQFQPDQALPFLRDSAASSRRFHLATLPMALVYQGTAHAQRGEGEPMEARLAEALTLAPDDLDVNGCAWGHCRATLSLLAEDRRRALAEMATGARFLRRSPATVAPPFLGLQVLLLAVEDDQAAALAEAERVRGSGATRHRIVGSLLGYAEAVLAGRAGRGGEAADRFAAADAEMGPLVAWYRQQARRQVAEAGLADGWGDPVAWLREATGFFAARGDERVAATCRALLRRAGAPVPRAGRGDSVVPPDLRAIGVTSREADVLALVAEGLTNQQIGARLYLSPRTVEKHVASLLAKTGGRRRAQLAKYAAALSR